MVALARAVYQAAVTNGHTSTSRHGLPTRSDSCRSVMPTSDVNIFISVIFFSVTISENVRLLY